MTNANGPRNTALKTLMRRVSTKQPSGKSTSLRLRIAANGPQNTEPSSPDAIEPRIEFPSPDHACDVPKTFCTQLISPVAHVVGLLTSKPARVLVIDGDPRIGEAFDSPAISIKAV